MGRFYGIFSHFSDIFANPPCTTPMK